MASVVIWFLTFACLKLNLGRCMNRREATGRSCSPVHHAVCNAMPAITVHCAPSTKQPAASSLYCKCAVCCGRPVAGPEQPFCLGAAIAVLRCIHHAASFTAHTIPPSCCCTAGAKRLAEDDQYLQAPVLSQQDLLNKTERPRATKLIKLDLAKLNEKAPVQYQSGGQLLGGLLHVNHRLGFECCLARLTLVLLQSWPGAGS